ncbi:MAG: shikimate kinase [Nitrososphaerota archaeon]|jgi:shikimate kinase|nr:shikimate kinase [Nitrososphaerota archaeon]
MIGRAFAYGAVSILNAVANGRGVTLGIDLKTASKVELHKGEGRWNLTINGEDKESRLAEASVDAALRLVGERISNFHGTIETQSNIPMGVGLKSSSSSSLAIIMATLQAMGQESFEPSEVLRASVASSLASGVSITGALDDAASCLLGGVNLADNLKRKLISSRRLPDRKKVVIRIPNEESRRRFINIKQVKSFRKVADRILISSLKGEYWSSMTMNGMLYSMLLGYDASPSITALDCGAVGAGLSGTGPAICAVFDSSNTQGIDKLRDMWAKDGSAVMTADTNNEKGGLVV